MMFFLICNILSDLVQDIRTYRNPKIIVLPGKSSPAQAILIYPVGRLSFN